MMRIITGKARGVRLDTLAGDATRPTSERAKEAVFSMLQFELEGRRVLDLFAGSGQMGLEAVSRGAACAVLVDASREAMAVIRRNVEKTRLAGCEAVQSTAAAYLSRGVASPFHLVFLDPPYAAGLLAPTLLQLLDARALTNGATVVCEAAAGSDIFGGNERLLAAFAVIKKARYGAAEVWLLRHEGVTV